MGMNLEHTLWAPCYRIIPSCYPPIHLFETVADPRDWEAILFLESITNPRIREEAGDIGSVPVEDRVSGPGTTSIMAAFTHMNPNGSRFSDGNFGVYYTALTLDTAIAETIHHQVRHLLETMEPPQILQMRVLQANLEADLVDLRGLGNEIYSSTDSYAESQRLGIAMKRANRDGILYWSVRDKDGQCAAVFKPRLLSNCIQSRHLGYPWNGLDIVRNQVFELSAADETQATGNNPA
jgi:hypothetical protein